MTIEGIIDKLKLHPALAANVAGRIFPVGLPPKETLPAISYEVTGGRQPASKDGPGSLQSSNLRFTVWALQQTQGRAVGTILAEALQWLRSTNTVKSVLPGPPNDDIHPDPGAWLLISTYTIWWRE